ncbi:MAG TPA: hypothetical protein VKY45_00330 [Marinilabiliaceae bacterium]|nr:hypothetical protein [Marinilabiliaceae bacterium]
MRKVVYPSNSPPSRGGVRKVVYPSNSPPSQGGVPKGGGGYKTSPFVDFHRIYRRIEFIKMFIL